MVSKDVNVVMDGVRQIRTLVEELRELGLKRAAFRAGWEALWRSGLGERLEQRTPIGPDGFDWRLASERLPFQRGEAMQDRCRSLSDDGNTTRLLEIAEHAVKGRLLCFGRWYGDFGLPLDWHRNPVTGARWRSDVHHYRAMRCSENRGDIKLVWEIGRFPQAFHLARAAIAQPGLRPHLVKTLFGQMESFASQNPWPFGVHWGSGQEIVFRLLAWTFAVSAVGLDSPGIPGERIGDLSPSSWLARQLVIGATHVQRHIAYARYAVYNNHILSEALGLLLAGTLVPEHPRAHRWRSLGLDLLSDQIPRQFYADGGYIQQSHNYHRLALQVVILACRLLKQSDTQVPREFTDALARSVDYLHTIQNPADGRLPNFGANDGALPLILSNCDYSDFRPTLQTAHVLARGERLYPPGPWDEDAAWLLGDEFETAPLCPRDASSASFAVSGHEVLRGDDPGTFAALRCGSVLDRFGQIDMLHLDLWWHGENLLVDGGSYLYNDAPEWHNYFMRTASHNTVVVDGEDQMLHLRKFKCIYPTRARKLRGGSGAGWQWLSGEHYGYERLQEGLVHRRCVLALDAIGWAIVDRVTGNGTHEVQLQWLCDTRAAFEMHSEGENKDGITFECNDGPVRLRIFDQSGIPRAGDIVQGGMDPPRGWLSRYYGERKAVSSLVVADTVQLPTVLITVIGPGAVDLRLEQGHWILNSEGGSASFTIEDDGFSVLNVERAAT